MMAAEGIGRPRLNNKTKQISYSFARYWPGATWLLPYLAIVVSIPGSFLLPALAASEMAQSWEQVQREGTEALDTGRYGVAEPLLEKAVIQSARFGEGDPRFARSLGELGRLYCVRGRFAEAEPLLEEELHARELAPDTQTSDSIPTMGALIRFYLEHGSASKANQLTDRLLTLVEGRLTEHRSGAQGPLKLEKGKPLTGWAGSVATSMRNPVIEWAIVCDAIGNAYAARGKAELAERLFNAALDVKEMVLGKQHLSLANSYDSLGTICMEKNNDLEAEVLLRHSLEHTERILPPQSPQVFARLDKLAKCLIKERKYAEAEQLYRRAQNFWKEKPSHDDSQARALYSLGSLYALEKKSTAAAPVLREALQQAEAYYGPDSISLVPYLQRYSDAMYQLKQDKELSQLKSRVNTISGLASQ